MADKNGGYIGNSPSDSSVTIARQAYTSSGITTDFTFRSGYTPGYLDAYLNGVRLIETDDYVATDGTTLSLTTAAQNGDTLELIAYKAFNVSDFTLKTEVGGNFDVSNNLTVGGNLDIDGTAELDILNVAETATFTGSIDANGNLDVDGHTELDDLNVSGVTTTGGLLDINAGAQANTLKVEDLTDNRVVIAGTGGEIEDDDNLTFDGSTLAVGVALDVDGHTELDDLNVSGVATVASAKISDLNSGRVVIAGTDGELEDSANLTFDGSNLSVGGNISVGGTLTYEDVTNVDSIGIVTAQSGIHIDDSIVHIGDTDTKIRFPAADTITAETGGTERLRITSGGSVGIGTDNPGAALHVLSTAYPTATITRNHAINYPRLRLVNAADDGADLDGIGDGGSTPGGFRISCVAAGVSTERLRITSDGKVRVPDNGKFTAGAGDDLQIYHDGTDNIIKSATTALKIQAAGSNTYHVHISARTDKETIICYNNTNAPYVELYYNNSKKLETTTTGAKVTGSLEVTQEYPTIRPTLDLNFAATKTLDRRITFTRDSVGTFTDDMGIVRYASNNVPRFDHDPTTGESLGLLIEESRTNLVKYSSEINLWTDNTTAAIIATDNTTAPDGRITADKLTQQTQVYAGKYIAVPEVTTNTTYSLSGFIKPVDQPKTRFGVVASAPVGWMGYVDTTWDANGVPTTTLTNAQNIQYVSYPNGWYKVSFQFTTDGSSLTNPRLHIHPDRNENGKSIWFWGAQLEVGSFATSYIPTNASTVTRAQDTPLITGTNFTDFYNQSEGTLVLSADIGYLATSNQAAVVFEDTSSQSTDLIALGYRVGGVASGNLGGWYQGNSAQVAFKDHSVGVTVNSEFRQAFAYKTNDFASVANGTTPLTDNSGTLSTSIDRVRFGKYYADGITIGHIRQFKYYNKRLPNAQLQGLTQQ